MMLMMNMSGGWVGGWVGVYVCGTEHITEEVCTQNQSQEFALFICTLQIHNTQHATPGEGEFGVVHKAIWNGTVVAAKVLKGSDAIALGDFRGELDVLRRVHHPNAVQFLGAQTANQPFVLVTELMYGKSLADAFKFTQVWVGWGVGGGFG